MSEAKRITPEEVKIITEVKTLYRAEGSNNYYLSEQGARSAESNARKCECGNYIEPHGWIMCKTCRDKKDQEKHLARLAAAPEWDGTYPACIGDKFFWDEDELFDYLIEEEIDPACVDDFYACTEVKAGDAFRKDWLTEHVEEEMGYEAECPGEIEILIDDFLAKLNAIEKPISWIGNKLVRLTEKQIQYFKNEISGCGVLEVAESVK